MTPAHESSVTPGNPRRRDPYAGFAGRAARTFGDSEPAWEPRARARPGAPNIVVVLIDDMGYSDIGPFGSEIPTPTLDALAERGVRLTNYHTMPLCSPARAALLTGLNPHRVGYSFVANADPGFPGYAMEIADDIPTLPQILHGAGYATFAVGKWHLVRDSASNAADDRRNWPLQKGFDRYYGVLEGLTSLFHPHQLVRDNSPLDIDELPEDYYYTDDITDEAIGMIKSLRAHDADKPFFLYVAHNAVHGPLQAKPSDIERQRGRYDGGWDALRDTRFAKQLADGLFPPGTRLPRRNFEKGHEVGPWDEVPPDARELYARYMEVYAAMVDNIDQNLGRLTRTLADLGELDNTVIVFTSDNGGTGEGGAEGTRAYFKRFVHHPGLPEEWNGDVDRELDLVGGPRSLIHYPRGWGMASNTPFRLYKGQTYAGGVRVPFVLSWPAGLPRAAEDGGVRPQYQYVTDILPTLLELVGVERPDERGGVPTQELDGISFTPVLASASEESVHREQYSEMTGNRSYYRHPYKLVTQHQFGAPYDDGEWALYDIEADPTEIDDLAGEHPGVVKELSEAWEAAAWRDGVFPLADASGALAFRNPDEEELRRPVRILAAPQSWSATGPRSSSRSATSRLPSTSRTTAPATRACCCRTATRAAATACTSRTGTCGSRTTNTACSTRWTPGRSPPARTRSSCAPPRARASAGTSPSRSTGRTPHGWRGCTCWSAWRRCKASASASTAGPRCRGPSTNATARSVTPATSAPSPTPRAPPPLTTRKPSSAPSARPRRPTSDRRPGRGRVSLGRRPPRRGGRWTRRRRWPRRRRRRPPGGPWTPPGTARPGSG